jgi:homopolymeric O-antigen transport system permease protein
MAAREVRAERGAPALRAVWRDPRATLPRMSQTEAAASLRHVSGTPGALELLREGLAEIASRRRLIRYLLAAEMRKRGSDTVLGNIWWVVDPLLQMLVYVIFVAILGRGLNKPDYPLFIFAAILPWKWFSAVIGDATTTVVRQERLIRQIAFPKIVLPVATTSAGVIGFAFGLIPLLGLMLLYPHRLSVMFLWVPVIAAVQYAFTLAAAIFVSAANVFFRDLGNALGHALRLWWFLSPGLYSLSSVHNLEFIKQHHLAATLVNLNPFAVLFEAYRAVIYGTPDGGPPTSPDLGSLAALFGASLILIALATIFFKRLEPNFAKVL